jgi:cobyrinic acid a,c-diamide synthase
MNGHINSHNVFWPEFRRLQRTKVPEVIRPLHQSHICPALLISAPASGQGKTTLTAALARYHRNQGHRVRVFKTGPDFLDPMILERASGHPVYQLDLWMVGADACRNLLHEAAATADLILVEGVMGLFDGTPSSADLAQYFDIPVLALINAGAMAQTFGAIAFGLANFRQGLPFAGVVANGVANPGHGALLAESLPAGLNYFGALTRTDEITLPNRHLGLVQAREIADLETRLERAAAAVAPIALAALPEPVAFEPPHPLRQTPLLLSGVRIGVARDAAFAFLYPGNLDQLRELGAELIFFSPLGDTRLPAVDSLYLPGGYPELYLKQLAANIALHDALKRHHEAGKPLYAECGGMLYLLETLTDKQGNRATMAGLLPGHGRLQPRLAGLGMQSAPLPEGELRGHTFHHSTLTTPMRPLIHGKRQRDNRPGEAVYRIKRLTATYLHLYFATDPVAAAQLFIPG